MAQFEHKQSRQLEGILEHLPKNLSGELVHQDGPPVIHEWEPMEKENEKDF